MMKKNPNVCINWTLGEKIAWQDVGIACSYRVRSKSVVAEGRGEFIEDYDEKVRCMEKLMAQYSNLQFKFSAPSINNVGVIKIHILKIAAKNFGAKTLTPWSLDGKDTDEGQDSGIEKTQ